MSYRVIARGIPVQVCGKHVHEVLAALEKTKAKTVRLEPGDGTCGVCAARA